MNETEQKGGCLPIIKRFLTFLKIYGFINPTTTIEEIYQVVSPEETVEQFTDLFKKLIIENLVESGLAEGLKNISISYDEISITIDIEESSHTIKVTDKGSYDGVSIVLVTDDNEVGSCWSDDSSGREVFFKENELLINQELRKALPVLLAIHKILNNEEIRKLIELKHINDDLILNISDELIVIFSNRYFSVNQDIGRGLNMFLTLFDKYPIDSVESTELTKEKRMRIQLVEDVKTAVQKIQSNTMGFTTDNTAKERLKEVVSIACEVAVIPKTELDEIKKYYLEICKKYGAYSNCEDVTNRTSKIMRSRKVRLTNETKLLSARGLVAAYDGSFVENPQTVGRSNLRRL